MNVSVILRLGSVGALAALLAGCGMAEADPHRFEGVADRIAAIPLSAKPEPAREPAAPRNAEEAGLRPLKVELLTPHQLWDARDGLTATAAAVLPAVPAVFHDPEAPPEVQAAASVQPEAQPLRRVAVSEPSSAVLIQLGAYASQASAQAAWDRLRQGGLNPVFEPVEVNGRRLVRLKVRAGSAQAKALCRRAAASDPWCVRAAEAGSSTGAA
ncbi:SPOR domain-containing protein [uncultured Brevundimonas sp.]|uniref:SPOR domain-containing protein n=1 Tax=uncultured Brevundimonas sp. TaxID=213418 RepID=UPI0025EBF948|nr:SPOR domain-containing protein [uncultured Brevundimonas sp.]